jgi:hypothetical protein
MTAERFFRVRGRVIDPRTGQPPRNANVRLESPEGGSSARYVQQFYNPADGSFDLREVAAGNYVLRADLPNPNPQMNAGIAGMRGTSPADREAYMRSVENAAMAEQAATLRIAAPITVNSNIDGLTPTPVVGSPVSGRLRFEPAAAASSVRLPQVRIELRTIGPNGAPLGNNSANASFGQNVRSDSSFRLEGVPPGEYVVRIRNGLPAGFFVKSARIGDIDALNGPVTLPLRDPNAILEVVVSKNSGQIEGAVAAADGRPLPGAQVVLIPNENRNRAELFRSITADAEGRFALPNVTPGDYRLAAWPSMEPFSWFDPAVIRQAEESGKAVQVTESSKQTVNVQAISGPE